MTVGVVKMLREPGLLLRRVGRREISQLIRETGKSSAIFRRREFVQVNRNNSPCALHHELHEESADD